MHPDNKSCCEEIAATELAQKQGSRQQRNAIRAHLVEAMLRNLGNAFCNLGELLQIEAEEIEDESSISDLEMEIERLTTRLKRLRAR